MRKQTRRLYARKNTHGHMLKKLMGMMADIRLRSNLSKQQLANLKIRLSKLLDHVTIQDQVVHGSNCDDVSDKQLRVEPVVPAAPLGQTTGSPATQTFANIADGKPDFELLLSSSF
jgi:hypothetical protein